MFTKPQTKEKHYKFPMILSCLMDRKATQQFNWKMIKGWSYIKKCTQL